MSSRDRITVSEFLQQLGRGRRNFAHVELHGLTIRESMRPLKFSQSVLVDLHVSAIELNAWDLSGALIRRPYFDRTTLQGCNFHGVTFERAHFTKATFRRCTMTHASLYRATLDTVAFASSDLSEMSLAVSRCDGMRFDDCKIANIDLTAAAIYDSDISPIIDTARTSQTRGPSFDWKTICKSLRGIRLLDFLLRCGIPEVMATYAVDSARAVDPLLLFKLMRSTFISYGGPDSEFARTLRDALHANGVRTFFFATDAVPGERLHKVMDSGVNDFDRVILICSEASLARPGVRNEIEETLAREARDGGATYLIPVTIDDYIFSWQDRLGRIVRDRVVADFRGTATDQLKFGQAVARLLTALRNT